jgi:copper(I)-binding protein
MSLRFSPALYFSFMPLRQHIGHASIFTNVAKFRMRALVFSSLILAACRAESPHMMQFSRVYVIVPAGTAPAVLYAVVENHTGQADTLTTITTPAARVAELHQTMATSSPEHAMASMPGMSGHDMTSMSMRPIPALPIDANATLRFAPGGYHVMLMDPAPLHAGDSVDVTFQFARAHQITTRAHVITYADVDTATEHTH